MENKICVYAICKNESQFVDRWLESMSEADYVVVLDTGSTDDTYDKLKADARVTRVEQIEIKPWRFDVARNESLKLVPEDANILVCTDLDETLDAGWADQLRSNWISDYHVRCHYKYAWSHNEDGTPARIFWYDKIHDRTYKWRAPVHELLYTDAYSDEYESEHTLNMFDQIYLHHYPDKTKSRSSYLPLLELRIQEDPNDHYGMYFLSHEYYYNGEYQKSIELLERLLVEFSSEYDEAGISAMFLFLGDNYKALGKNFLALENYSQAIKIEPTLREAYIEAAQVMLDIGFYSGAAALLNDMFAKTWRHYIWTERDESWGARPHDLLSICYCYLEEYEHALISATKALSFSPNDERIKGNIDYINAKIGESVL